MITHRCGIVRGIGVRLCPCVAEFQAAFPDVAADRVKWRRFSGVLPSPCRYISPISKTVSHAVRSESSKDTGIRRRFPASELPPHSPNRLTTLRGVDGEIPQFFSIFGLKNVLLLSLLSWSSAQSGEPRAISAYKDRAFAESSFSTQSPCPHLFPVHLLSVECFKAVELEYSTNVSLVSCLCSDFWKCMADIKFKNAIRSVG